MLPDPKLILAWAALFAFTAAYGFARHGRLSRQTVVVGLATATVLVAVSRALPTAAVGWQRVLAKWIVHFSLFTLATRAFARSSWRDSLHTGFFSATCVAILHIFA